MYFKRFHVVFHSKPICSENNTLGNVYASSHSKWTNASFRCVCMPVHSCMYLYRSVWSAVCISFNILCDIFIGARFVWFLFFSLSLFRFSLVHCRVKWKLVKWLIGSDRSHLNEALRFYLTHHHNMCYKDIVRFSCKSEAHLTRWIVLTQTEWPKTKARKVRAAECGREMMVSWEKLRFIAGIYPIFIFI